MTRRARTFVERDRPQPPPIGVWLATGTPTHKPYPCRCRGNCTEQTYPCYCHGRSDTKHLPTYCCAYPRKKETTPDDRTDNTDH